MTLRALAAAGSTEGRTRECAPHSSGGRIPTSAARTKTWSARSTPPRIASSECMRAGPRWRLGADSVWPVREHVFATMPWKPRYTEAEARAAIQGAESWGEVLQALGYGYFGKNIQTVRKWAVRWGISTEYLPTSGTQRYRYTKSEAKAAIAASRSWTEALRRLGYCHTGANPRTLRKRAAEWGISTAHFDPYAASNEALRREPKPLHEILVEGSTYSRSNLKQRLYDAGLKQRRCELCGQGELWRGRRIGLILDHANGVRDDNRIENLRIVCPNCAAALDTHCGKRNRIPPEPRDCLRCGTSFFPKFRGQRYCSRYCGSRWDRTGVKRPGARKVKRPPRAQLLSEVEEHGYLGVGRRYGVSDNAIRKWLREYERERAIAEGRDPDEVEIPRRTWPNRRRDREDGAGR